MSGQSEDKAQMFVYVWAVLSGMELRPVPEYEFDKHIGRKHRFDWAFPDYRIAVEVDGGQWEKFGGRHNTDKDREKRNIAASLRWLVFYFSPDQLRKEPEKCVQFVVRAIQDSI
jgi:very-short-patch-repair endonuclease